MVQGIRLGPRCGYCCMCPTASISEIYVIHSGTATGPSPFPKPESGCQCFCICGWEDRERARKQSAPRKPPSLKTWPEPRKDWK